MRFERYLNYGDESCEVTILSRSIQETYTLRKVKKTGFIVCIELRINSKIFRVISYDAEAKKWFSYKKELAL